VSRKPSVGVVGVGYMGALHAQKLAVLADEGIVEFVGVLDADPETALAVSDRLGVPRLGGIDELADAVDAAIVAAPTVDHGHVAGRLLEGGVDVLVEKPIASTREEARRMIELARRGKRILQVGHIERFSGTFRELLLTLHHPRFIEVHRIGPYPGRAVDVGVVLDLMIHDLDLILHLAGSEIDHVEGIGVAVLSRTEDIANARLRFANGCIVNITASRVSLETLRRIRFFQADAYVSIDFVSGRVVVARRKGEPGSDPPPEIQAQEYAFERGDALLEQDRAFVRAVRERSAPEVTGEDGYRALDLALRIQESLPPLEELLG
jgi:predicted dehydrogenase